MDNITFTALFVAFAIIPIAWVIVSHHLQKANSKRIYEEFPVGKKGQEVYRQDQREYNRWVRNVVERAKISQSKQGSRK